MTRPLSLVCLLGASLVALGCSEEDEPAVGVGGSAGAGPSGAGGAATGGAAGNAGAGGGGRSSTGGTAGGMATAGSGNGGSAGSGQPASEEQDAGLTPGVGSDSGPVAFVVSSPAFDNNPGCGPGAQAAACDLFPEENTNLGGAANVSPAIDWTGVPAGTLGFAIALHDLSNLQGQDPFTHWVMWNIPGTTTELPAMLPSGAMPGVPAANTQQVSIGMNDSGYVGSGARGNVYEFVLYALDTATFVPANMGSPNAVQNALDASDAVLDTARMRARSAPTAP